MVIDHYFRPLDLTVLLVVGIFILAFDQIGRAFFPKPKGWNWLTPAMWIFGLALFIFFNFIFHFILPFSRTLSLAILTILLIPSVIANYKLRSLLPKLMPTFLSVLIILAFSKFMLKPLFYYASMPPHIWDEMAYHYLSPAQIINEKSWQFSPPTFYAMLPRTIETSFVTLFTITNTYSSGRLLQLCIYLSVIASSFLWLKENSGVASAIFFVWLLTSFSPNVFIDATSGYVDVGAASLIILFILIMAEWIKQKDFVFFPLIAAAAGISISVKYTTIFGFFATWLSTFFLITVYGLKKMFFTIKNYLYQTPKFLLFFILFGGYWYLKNFIVSADPIFPFISRPELNTLADWNYLTINWDSIEQIKLTVVPTNEIWQLVSFSSLLAVVYSISFKKYIYLRGLMFLWIILLAEILLLSKFGLFDIRFFQHWLILLPFIFAYAIPIKFNWIFKKNNWTALLAFGLILSVSVFLIKPVRAKSIETYSSLEKFSGTDQWFVTKKISFSEWLKKTYPVMNAFIISCAQEPKTVHYQTADPYLIWFGAGLTRIFLINCYIDFIPHSIPINWQTTDFHQFIDKEMPYLSTTDCVNDPPTSEDKIIDSFFHLNNQIVCQSDKIREMTYRVQ